MTKKYNILWIDDEFEDLTAFAIDAENNDIILDGYKSYEEAFENFEARIMRYDGVLLDGMFFEKMDQVNGSEDERGIAKTINRLAYFEHQKFLPWFVLSGKKEFTKNANSILIGHEKRCFDKTDIRDYPELFFVIKAEADELPTTQLRHKYEQAFNVFLLDVIDVRFEHILYELLKCLRDEDYKKKNLTIVRDLLEIVYESLLYNYDCIPLAFAHGRGNPNLSKCTRYLSNRPTNADNGISYRIPYNVIGHISWSLAYVKEIGSEFSHLSDDAILKNPFISAAHAMLEVLEWLPGFIKDNSIPSK